MAASVPRRWAGPVLALALAVTAAVAAAVPAWPQTLPAGLDEGRAGAVEGIVDGDTLILADGREVRLVGLQAPKLALGRPGFREWPLAAEAKAALQSLAGGRRVALYYGGARRDRHGRELAHLVRMPDRLWIQGAMLQRGMARVYSFPDNTAAVGEMLALERAARAAGRGIWNNPFYAIVPHEGAGRYIGTFQLVEGRVRRTAVIRRWAYINFGPDWRTDFTVSIRRRALAPFRARFGRDLRRLEGKRIRVRGWLGSYNGPVIEANHSEQIEVLER